MGIPENPLEGPVLIEPAKASSPERWEPYVADLQDLVDEQNEKIDDLETACREIAKAIKKIEQTLGGKFIARGEYFGVKI